MKQVVIGIDKNGVPYVVAAPRKIEVVFKKDKSPTWKKRFRRIIYQLKHWIG